MQRRQRKYNRKLYADFKEEACLRYLYRFHTAGLLDAPVARNAVEQCGRIKSVERLASEVGLICCIVHLFTMTSTVLV